jgi:hypothetical protein
MTEKEVVEEYGNEFANVLAMTYRPRFDQKTMAYYWPEWQIEKVELYLSWLGVYER